MNYVNIHAAFARRPRESRQELPLLLQADGDCDVDLWPASATALVVLSGGADDATPDQLDELIEHAAVLVEIETITEKQFSLTAIEVMQLVIESVERVIANN